MTSTAPLFGIFAVCPERAVCMSAAGERLPLSCANNLAEVFLNIWGTLEICVMPKRNALSATVDRPFPRTARGMEGEFHTVRYAQFVEYPKKVVADGVFAQVELEPSHDSARLRGT